MRRIMISNTHYQTIVAIQLMLTLFKDDDTLLLISDHSIDSDLVVERLKSKKLFTDVKYIRTKSVTTGYSHKKAWEDFIAFTFLKKNRYSFYLDGISNLKFDEIMVFNLDPDIYGIYAFLYEYNPDVTISRFEEGVLSYSSPIWISSKMVLSGKIRHFLKKSTVNDALKDFYCFFPSLYKGEFSPVQLPFIKKNSECTNVLRDVFLNGNTELNYDSKYIFFTGVCDFEGGNPIGEIELVLRVAELVGKDNLLVKTHPRDTRSIYKEYGLQVDKNSSIPWEAIQLTGDFQRNVFLTTTSGGVLAGSFMTDENIKTIYLHELCDLSNNTMAQQMILNLSKLFSNETMKDVFSNITIAKDLKDIL